MRRQKVVVTFFIVLAQFFSGCSDTENPEDGVIEECIQCSMKQELSSISNAYGEFSEFQFLIFDSLENKSIEFALCDSSLVWEIEGGKVVKINGVIYKPCQDSISYNFISIDNDYTLIETCLPSLDTLEGTWKLTSQPWFFYEISTDEGSIKPPCETKNASMYFNENGNISGAFGDNSVTTFSNIVGNTRLLEKSVITLVQPKTLAEKMFMETYIKLVKPENSSLSIQQHKNWILIENTETKFTAKLYTTQ